MFFHSLPGGVEPAMSPRGAPLVPFGSSRGAALGIRLRGELWPVAKAFGWGSRRAWTFSRKESFRLDLNLSLRVWLITLEIWFRTDQQKTRAFGNGVSQRRLKY